jgi:hypothetical protein
MSTLFMEDEMHFVRERKVHLFNIPLTGDTKSLAGFSC